MKRRACVIGAALWGFAASATGAAASTEEAARARAYFTDLAVLTQHGEPKRFYSDLLAERLVVVSLFYTDCIAHCPLTNGTLARVQALLGEAFGKDFFFVSVTLDPENDTPEVLARYAAKFGARPGWSFVTGAADDLRQIAARLGQTSTNIANHSPYYMLGDVRNARWVRLPPEAPPALIARRLRQMAAVAGIGG